MNPYLASSVDPNQLALTVKGALVMVVPVAGIIMKMTGYQIDDAILQEMVDKLSDAVIALGTAISAVMMAVGVLRKIIASFKSGN